MITELNSKPYIDLTLAVMKMFGVAVKEDNGTYFINGLVPGCMYICDASAGNVGIELYPISSSNARYEFLVSSTDFGSYALKLFNHISSFASLFDYTQATNVGSYVSVYYYASSSAIAYGNLDS